MRVAIVGARARNTEEDRTSVYKLVSDLETAWGDELVIISGGAQGIDTFAAEAARTLGVACMVIRPERFDRNASRHTINQAYYARNEKIVLEAEEIHAYISNEGGGGTANTIAHAKRLGRRVEIHYPFDQDALPVPDVEP